MRTKAVATARLHGLLVLYLSGVESSSSTPLAHYLFLGGLVGSSETKELLQRPLGQVMMSHECQINVRAPALVKL